MKWNRVQFVVVNNATKTMNKFQTFLGHNCEHCTWFQVLQLLGTCNLLHGNYGHKVS